MSPLPPEASNRLVKLCGMLGSEHAGERASAGLKASELLKQHGMAWADVIQTMSEAAFRLQSSKAERRAADPEWRPFKPESVRILKEYQHRALVLLHCGYGWNDWEREFLSSVHLQRYPTTSRQEAKLSVLRAKVDEWRKRQAGAA